jgi:osmotically-inducible protein OsmY
VKTYKERQEAEDLAKKVPQVQQVINEIQINGGKPSPANS